MAAISFFKPALFRKDMDAVLQTMVDEKIGPGEKKRAFIKAMSLYLSKKDGVALRTYLDAITISLKALNLNEGDSCALSVFTPSIYLDALKRLGIKPYLTDVSDDMLPSLDEIKKGLDQGVKALVLFLPLGLVVQDGDSYKELGLPIIEDVTQAIGSTFKGVKPGRIGDIVICNTEEDAIVSSAGGALVLSDKDEIIEEVKKEVNSYSPYIELPDLNASLGIVQLDKLDQIILRRNTIYKLYFDEARKKNKVKVFGYGGVDFVPNGYGFSVVVNDRPDEVIQLALKYQVSLRKTFSKAIGAKYQDRYDRFPNAFPFLSRGVSFPLYPFLSNAEIQTVQKVIGILR